MKILVVGRGWVGRKMFEHLSMRNHVVAVCSHSNAIQTVKQSVGYFDWVVNCAGVTGSPNVDACESAKAETIEANALFPVLLYDAIESMSGRTRLAHFSSGCIYQGEIDSVDADPNYFGSIYSVSKGISDVYLKSRALVLRVRLPFSGENEPKNLLTKLYNYAKNGKLVDGGLNSITDIDEAVFHTATLIETNHFGPVNLVNKGAVTTTEIAEMMGLQAEWYTADEFKSVTAAARSNCVIPEYSGMSHTRDALANAIRQFKETV
jgi:dTDP-4-dehydrorhamnose reductase